ncbi:MAG: glycosyltransferase family 39 protein [Bacteroidota bacterium]
MAKLFTLIKFYLYKQPYLLLILLAGAFLRFYHINFQSLWDDELATLIETDPTLKFKAAIQTYMEFDNMPPLYLLLLRYTFIVFGHTALVLRSFSALLGIASIGAMYLLAKSIYNKRSAYIAATFLAFNYFQIFYAQEGRPYTFFTLFTILSFYRLVLYFQNNSLKNALYYALFTLLMLYGQYVALFAMAAQGLIILVFLIFFQKEKKGTFFWHFLLAYIIVLIGYLPALPQLIKNAGIQSSWIPFPPPDVFSGFFKEFFGNSELILPLVYLAIILFFTQLLRSSEKNEQAQISETNSWQKLPFTFLILALWISVYLLIPLIRTYTSIPILVPRYFNPIIPAICLMAGIGIAEIKSKIIQITFMVLLVAFTITDLFVIKRYYNTPGKPQYRDNAAFVLQSLKADEPLVTIFWWHYQYFFRPSKADKQIQYGTLDTYCSKLQNDNQLPSAFWYLGTHDKNLALSPVNTLFLKDNYNIEQRADFHEVNATHFVRKNEKQIILNLNKFEPTKENENRQLLMNGSASIRYEKLLLEKGTYQFCICAKSTPDEPLNGIQAHLSLKINNQLIGGFFVKESRFFSKQCLSFVQKESGLVQVELLFDNDWLYKNIDRNVIFSSLYFEKK